MKHVINHGSWNVQRKLATLILSLVVMCGACTQESSTPADTPEAIAKQLASEAIADFRNNAATGIVFSKTVEAPPGSEVTSHIGGLPTRLGDAEWPFSTETGKPLLFIAQIARDPVSEKLMGDIGMVQIFADVRHFSGELSDNEGITIQTYGVDDLTERGEWDSSLVEAASALLESAFGEPLTGGELYLVGRVVCRFERR